MNHHKYIALILLLFLTLPLKSFSYVPPKDIKQALSDVYQQYKNEKKGKNASYIPELNKVNPNFFGIAIVTVNGEIFSIGDTNIPFAIESISKPFLYALALQDNGEKIISEKIGLNATGHSFNSMVAIEEKSDHLQNPYVNAGAIQLAGFIKGKTSADKWQRIISFINQLSDNKIYLGKAVYFSEMSTNQHNRAIAELINSYGRMGSDPMDAVERYTKACSLMITTQELALMGASLANNGVQPITHRRVVAPLFVKDVLSQMLINGLYENSGTWLWNVGIPAKSGVGGGIVAIIPNQMAIAVFSPPLDEAGNSVRAQEVIKALSKRWNLHLLGRSRES